jgi:hypothetical protein
MSLPLPGWTNVLAEIDRIIGASTEPLDANIIGNVRDLMGLLQGRYRIPAIGKGYGNTICLDWPTTTAGPLQIEVFDDRLEVYHFEPAFDVWYELHQPGQPFTSTFVAALPPLVEGT